jgi:hypothetical protein
MYRLFLLTVACLFGLGLYAQDADSAGSTQQVVIQNALPEKLAIEIPQSDFSIYPNPAKNRVSLQVTGFEPGIVSVKITDSKGKLWRNDNRLLTNGQEDIAMYLSLAPGFYFVALSQKNKSIKRKLIILQ